MSISSEGTVSDTCGPVSTGSVGAGISLIKVWKSVQETSTNLFRAVLGEIGYIYIIHICNTYNLFSQHCTRLLYQNTVYLP